MKRIACWLVGLVAVTLCLGAAAVACPTPAAAALTFQKVTCNVSPGHTWVAAGDLDGDHKPDLAATDRITNSLSILLGDDEGGFTLQAVAPGCGSGPAAVAICDLDHDGVVDLVTADYTGQTVSALLGNGDGTFAAPVTSPVTDSPSGIATGDFNSDNKTDLVTSNRGAATVSVLLGNGDGTFQTHREHQTGSWGYQCAVADLNGDRKLDVIAANMYAGSVSVLLGSGDGTFQPHVDYASGNQPNAIAVGDVTGDGKLDAVTPNYDMGTTSVLPGNGDGTFGPRIVVTTSADSASIAVGDVTADGTPDLICPSTAGRSIQIMAGDGHGGFTALGPVSLAPYAPSKVTVADLNSDGLLDIAMTMDSTPTLTVLLNQTTPFGTMTVAGGSAWVNTPVVAIASSVTGAKSMRCRDTSQPWPASLAAYSPSTTLTLSPGDGMKTVEAEYRSGTLTAVPFIASATIGLDTVAPATTCTGAGAGWHKAPAKITFVAGDATSGVARTEYRLDGGDWAPGTSTTIAAQGSTLVVYRSADNAGNQEAPRSVHVRVDTRKPVTRVSACHAQRDRTAVVKFRIADARPGSPTATARITVRTAKGKLVRSTVRSGLKVNTAQNWRFTCSLKQGEYRIRVTATDAAGNVSPTATAKLTVE